MGQFSWLDCVTEEQILCNKRRKVYVLVPKEFGGGHIEDKCYDGYGRFGGNDIFNLVAEWNRKYVSHYNLEDIKTHDWSDEDIEFYLRGLERQMVKVRMLIDFKNGVPDDQMIIRYGNDYKRRLGIDIACYDYQNENLKYPIKITYDEMAIYEDCKPSHSDPKQGWR